VKRVLLPGGRDVPEPDDALLVEQARRGSVDARAELFERHWPSAWRTAYAIVANRAVADDVAQDGIVRAFASLGSFERGRRFEPWLKRIVANRALDELRRERRRPVVEAQAPRIGAEPSGEEPALAATSARPARAIAANVPIHPEDRPHRLPYRTLLALPADGIVLVAIFATISEAGDASHPPPLRVTDARRELAWGAVEIRPERPLGRLQLRAPAGGYHVDVRIYFGEPNPSARALAEAQRQLDRLVISG
jgi:RNA polymerase sigma factor (sigma-70 family)